MGTADVRTNQLLMYFYAINGMPNNDSTNFKFIASELVDPNEKPKLILAMRGSL